MPSWTIISPHKKDVHPLRMDIFRVMRTVYHLLDPAIEPSTVDDTKHIATLESTISQTKPGRPGLPSAFIHFRLSTEIVTHFSIIFCEMQIEDKVQNMCISVPRELGPVMMNIYEFVLKRSAIQSIPESECDLAHRIWKGLQVEKYHKRIFQLADIGDMGLDAWSSLCCICLSGLVHCNSCQVASCSSPDCRGSSQPPLVRCATHQEKMQCFPCLEEKPKRELVKCPQCESWYCTTDIFSCGGRPVIVPPVPREPKSKPERYALFATCAKSARSHPPKLGSCMNCEPSGWQSCKGTSCWSGGDLICPECTSGGMTCLCQDVWACNLCTDHTDIFTRCPRCDRPFCSVCSSLYIDRCSQCERVTLCYDCIEEVPGSGEDEVQEALSSKLVAACNGCQMKVCGHCLPRLASTSSCVECLWPQLRRYIAYKQNQSQRNPSLTAQSMSRRGGWSLESLL